MSEHSAQVIQGGADPQSTLLHNIRQLSGVMEAAQNAGHEGFAGGVSGLRSDLMNIAGMSSGYDPRSPEDVKRDFYAQGPNRIEALVQEASSLPDKDGLGSALAGRIAGVGAGLTANGYMQKPELQQDIDVGRSAAQQQAKNSVVGALAGVLKGGQQQGAEQGNSRWQDLASKPSKGHGGPGL